LELATLLSDGAAEQVDVVLVDKADSFVFGYSKLDVMFGRATPDAVRVPYAAIDKPGVRFVQETVTSIDPEARRLVTDEGEYQGDVLVIALGADYDLPATPGLAEHGDEFYSVAGAERLTEAVDSFSAGRIVIGVCKAPYKCPPAPSETALLLHDALTARGVRGDCEIELVMPLPAPVPPSPDTSAALLAAFAERQIRYTPDRAVTSLREGVAVLDEGSERAKARDAGDTDRIGARSSDYHHKVELAFRLIAAEEPERVRLIDASGAPAEVTQRLLDAITDLLR
jgi:sulfide:quinone oxidoreductase